MRNVLWEARQAAEFAAAARAAAASQRTVDSRDMGAVRRKRKAAVRKHKRDLRQVNESRCFLIVFLLLW